MKPVLLDLFCGAGGATKGYQDAGFFVVGVDLNPQPNYCGDRFIQADAVQLLRDLYGGPYTPLVAGTLGTVAAIHASPPCQFYSSMSKCRPGLADKYPNLVPPVQQILDRVAVPWVIENVEGSPLRDPVMLCGTMFGRELYRHRLFESNVSLTAPDHPKHVIPASKAGHWKPGTIMSISGHVSPVSHAREIMAMDWSSRDELAEAIPPYYTEFIGRQLIDAIEGNGCMIDEVPVRDDRFDEWRERAYRAATVTGDGDSEDVVSVLKEFRNEVQYKQAVEMERLRQIIARTREFVDHPGNWSALDGRRKLLLHLLDGGLLG